MKTPIVDFVRSYAESDTVRLHMPGHKGKSFLGCESLDITEICGADTLYSADGIINESENNASELFGTAHSFYSAEGSTLAIKAMLALATKGKRRHIMAARNVHKAFVYACALLDLTVDWLYPSQAEHLCACRVTPCDLETALANCSELPSALYLTSPDYLGNILDIEGIAKVCKSYRVPLLVDNAHGAYLKFLSKERHPVSLGADICCDSAHKTLPVLTGGAYLHISKSADEEFSRGAREALSIFSSTSPSYLVLQSLDLCNRYLSDGYRERLEETVQRLERIKESLRLIGFHVEDTEPLKLTIAAGSHGYTGTELAQYLRENHIEVEFADCEYVVIMVTPENTDAELDKLVGVLKALPKGNKKASLETMSLKNAPETVISIREAVLSESETVSVEEAVGRICASPTVSCPPAVPILVAGEVVTPEALSLFAYYGIEALSVTDEGEIT